MKRRALLLVLVLCGLYQSAASTEPDRDFTHYVNPFVGTDFHGHTFPGATYPFGMIQLSPDTREDNWDGCSGYHYSDSTIRGFSHTHLCGTGCADLCDLLIMPVSSYDMERPITLENYESRFSHESEYAVPGYYSVYLDRWGIDAELTVGRRTGLHKYTYRRNEDPQIIIDLEQRDHTFDSNIDIVGKNAIQGYRHSKSWADDQRLYFYIEFSKPFEELTINNLEGNGAKALFRFKKSVSPLPNNLYLRVGISSVSEENARNNVKTETLLLETPQQSFNRTRKETAEVWNNYLSKIEVEGDEETMKIFYTALYHTAIAPSLYSDSNGEYRGMDHEVHKAIGYDRYTIFSLWDTFRSLHPLLNIIERERSVDFIKSFLSIYDECGKLPIWELWGNETNCMIGYNSIPVIADAYAKGIRDFDIEKALKAMVASSNKNEYGIADYRDNGLVLAEKEHESVSKTLEYAFDDWCVARTAQLAREQIKDSHWCDSVINAYMMRALSYRNIYDPESGFMRPRINGIWLNPFNPNEVNVHYTEANSWQYTFHVQQDISGLIDLFGGEDLFDERLDELFSASSELSGWNSADMTGMIGQYVQGNEPSHHIAYLYNYVGKPWKSQRVLRQIMTELFTTEPDGLCGNEDCGQMSAWYVLSALGFYPVTPGSDIYVFGTPMFRRSIIHYDQNTRFVISALNINEKNVYIHNMTRNGVLYNKSWFTFDEIKNGTSFRIDMAEMPGNQFGISPANRPVSETDADIVTNPWFQVESPVFSKSTQVAIESQDNRYTIKYRISNQNELTDTLEYRKYSKPFTVDRTCTVSAFCESPAGERSRVTECTLTKSANTYGVEILTQYSRQYNAGGDKGIVDGIRGKENFRLGGWQGYQDCDFEAVIDLGESRHISRVAAGFLQDAKSWIWMPQNVEFLVSEDGENFTSLGSVGHEVDERDYTVQIHDLGIAADVNARYVKVLAKNLGEIPHWHPGAGSPAFIFVDEVMIF